MGHILKSQVRMVRSLQQKKYRDELGLFVAEGRKCVNDLRDVFDLELLIDDTNATDVEIEQMSSLRVSQGVIGVFRKKEWKIPDEIENSGLLLALDGIQDPGNLGTIIRTADWFGFRDVFCSKETADCYNPKVVQATMGALGRVRVHYIDLEAWVDSLNCPIYGTLLNGRNMYTKGAIESADRGIVVMGNEGNGISESIRTRITHPLLIPCYPDGETASESLNVSQATAIVLAEFRRRLR